MKTIILKYILATSIVFIGIIVFVIFFLSEADNLELMGFSAFSLACALISFFWIIFSTKGKLHPRLKKVFWISSLAFVFSIEAIYFLLNQLNWKYSLLYSLNAFLVIISIFSFYSIISKKDSKIAEEEQKTKQKKEFEEKKRGSFQPYKINCPKPIGFVNKRKIQRV